MRFRGWWLAMGGLALAVTTAACGSKSAGGGRQPPADDDTTAARDAFLAEIVEPNGSAAILAGEPLRLEARFTRGAIRVQPATVSWTADGVLLGTGNPLGGVALTSGSHVIEVSATVDGESAKASVTLAVGQLEVLIERPSDGSARDVGTELAFAATARVSNGVAITRLVTGVAAANERVATFAWSSNLDGALGSTREFRLTTLSAGEHVVSLTVTDDDAAAGLGASATASVRVRVLPPNTRPTVQIVAPAACPVDLVQGQALALTASASDAEDGALEGSWLDSVSGDTAKGLLFAVPDDAVLGKHELRFSATDSSGASSTATCAVYVVPADGGRAALFPAATSVNAGLAEGDKDIRYVGHDGAGHTFVGNDKGLSIYDASGALLGTYDGDALDVSGDTARVNDIAVIDGGLVIATEEGLARCDFADGVLTNCAEVTGGDYACAAANTPETTLIVGGRDGGLYISLSRPAGSSSSTGGLFDSDSSNLPGDEVRDVLLLGATLLVGTNEGLCIIPDVGAALDAPATLCAEVVSGDGLGLGNADVRALADAGGGRLWIGTDEGLVLYDLATGEALLYDQRAGLGSAHVNDIVVDAAGIVWIATDAGLSRLDPSTDAVTSFTGVDWGNPGNHRVRSIDLDGAGVKWLGTDQGVIRYAGN